MAIKGDSRNVGLYLSGQEVPIIDCNIFISPPTIKQILAYGEDNFLVNLNLLIHTDKLVEQVRQGNSQLEIFSDFQVLIAALLNEKQLKRKVLDFLVLLFPKYQKILIKEAAIDFYIVQEEKEILVGKIHPFNFEAFQNILSDLFEPKMEDDKFDYNPTNDKAKEIAEKLKKGREKANRQKNGDDGPQSMFARYVSILSIGMSMDVNIFFNYTPFQLYDAFLRYNSKVAYDIFQKISTTPFMDVSKMEAPDDWTRNLYKQKK